MTTCIFDIETAPLPETDIAMLAPKFEAPGNYTDSVKIAAHIQKQRQEWLDRAALSPLTGTVAAIGYKNRDDLFVSLASQGMSEAALIRQFWNYFRVEYEHTQFVGFNIFRFDLPFLIRRSWKLGVDIPLGLYEGRYFSRSFVDLMEVWQGPYRAEERISLDQLAKFLGCGAKNGNGADFYKLPPEQQREYLSNDLALTYRVALTLLENHKSQPDEIIL